MLFNIFLTEKNKLFSWRIFLEHNGKTREIKSRFGSNSREEAELAARNRILLEYCRYQEKLVFAVDFASKKIIAQSECCEELFKGSLIGHPIELLQLAQQGDHYEMTIPEFKTPGQARVSFFLKDYLVHHLGYPALIMQCYLPWETEEELDSLEISSKSLDTSP